MSHQQRSEGKYVSYVSVSNCGEASSSGQGYTSGDYLCEIEVPGLSQDNDGYYITSFARRNVSDKAKARCIIIFHFFIAN